MQDDHNRPATIYILGANMLEANLQGYVNDLTTALQGSAPVIYANTEDQFGSTLAERYEIEESQIPSILIVIEDEEIYKSWHGQDLPATDQVVYEIGQITGGLGD